MCACFAYLSQGKLYLKSGEAPEVLYESPFVRGIRDRAIELHRRHSWKSGGSGERMIPRAALWGANASDPALVQIHFNSIAAQGGAAGFVYSVFSREISGVLAHQEGTGSELRLLHTADFQVTHVSSQAGTGRIAKSLNHRGGATLAVMDGDWWRLRKANHSMNRRRGRPTAGTKSFFNQPVWPTTRRDRLWEWLPTPFNNLIWRRRS